MFRPTFVIIPIKKLINKFKKDKKATVIEIEDKDATTSK